MSFCLVCMSCKINEKNVLFKFLNSLVLRKTAILK